MSSTDSAIPGGQPSTTQPIAGPCDSPKVVTVKRVPRVLPDMDASLLHANFHYPAIVQVVDQALPMSYWPGNMRAGEKMRPIPVVDIFAGPGGLSEGFSAARDSKGQPMFRVQLSIEKDETAHRTLRLRALHRLLGDRPAAATILHRYFRGEIPFEIVAAAPRVTKALEIANHEARCAELGRTSPSTIDGWIEAVHHGATNWVLIGGPPCQAYSLAGRSRRAHDKHFEADEKHFLYREYLRILAKHGPSAFVMENVKGLLSATHGGESMFGRILEDLSNPRRGLRYQIRSFIINNEAELTPKDYVIKADQFGVPQRRHRVILFGIREGLFSGLTPVLRSQPSVTLFDVIGDLPVIRSKLSHGDSLENWHRTLTATRSQLTNWRHPLRRELIAELDMRFTQRMIASTFGGRFVPANGVTVKGALRDWLLDTGLNGVYQHEGRSHMAADLQRYAFVTCFANLTRRSPKLADFPEALLPRHKNAKLDDAPFADRFRVQLAWEPATTVVSHIAKDGHYYIHPDATQCRALTVREAARVQTFPDNYFFEGNRTQQYTQVGNAVPPFLARQLAEIVGKVLR
jgi:DNA (cytosine-5)-methyltransferase 1